MARVIATMRLKDCHNFKDLSGVSKTQIYLIRFSIILTVPLTMN